MLKELHDSLLALQPEGASHDADSCPVCNEALEASKAFPVKPEGGTVSKTYTEEEYNALLAQVADLEAQMKELEGVRQESQVEARIAEIKEQTEAQIQDLQSQLDTAVLEAQAAKDEKDQLVAYFEALATEEEQKAAFEERKAEVVRRVKEVANFTDDYIEARVEAWAKADEEVFEGLLVDWAAIAKKTEESEETPPRETAMAARSETPSKRGSMREVLALRNRGIDVRMV